MQQAGLAAAWGPGCRRLRPPLRFAPAALLSPSARSAQVYLTDRQRAVLALQGNQPRRDGAAAALAWKNEVTEWEVQEVTSNCCANWDWPVRRMGAWRILAFDEEVTR